MPRISMCDATDRIRLRSSSWKPFITDRTTISAATPSAIPAIDVSAMNEMKRVAAGAAARAGVTKADGKFVR